jgi:hypothetical protein
MSRTSVFLISPFPRSALLFSFCILTAGGAMLLGGCQRQKPVTVASAPAIDYGAKVSFGQDGNSERFRLSGWSKAEEKFTWTEGPVAVLRMRIPATQDSVTLRMKLSGLAKEPILPFQPLEVRVNDQKVADWEVSNAAEFAAAIPPDVTRSGGELTITLKTLKATSPQSLGLNTDSRVLGICCFEFELSKG